MIINPETDTDLSHPISSVPEIRHIDIPVCNLPGKFLQENSSSEKKGEEAHYIFFSLSSPDRSGSWSK